MYRAARRLAWPSLILLLALPAAPAPARAPRGGGLGAVALSPDGKTVVVGGQNRVVYFLDAPGLEVKRRLWLGARVSWLSFNRDGRRLLIEDDAETLHFYDPASGKQVLKVPNCTRATVAPAADLVAARDPSFFAGTRLRLLSASDGSEKGRIELKEQLAAYAFGADGKELVVLTEARAGAEKKVPPDKVPPGLTGLARKEFRLKNDGLVSTLRTLAVPTGKVLREAELWYTSGPDNTTLAAAGAVTWALNFTNECARIEAGRVKLFETELLFNHGLGVSPDGKVLVCGGLREGSTGPLEGGPRVKFEIDALPGWPEYFASFAVANDGTAYGVTSAFRLVRVEKGGKVTKVVPVF
jgi:hypothetical protein